MERLARAGSRAAPPRVLSIKSDVRLSKPLVVGAGLTLEVAAGATLRLAAQPALPKREVFTGRGSVLFEGGRPSSPDEFWVLPEWWGAKAGAPGSDALERATAACAGARCTLVLTRVYLLQRPWRLPAGTGVWAGPAAELKGAPGGAGQGVVLGAGAWERAGRVALPRLLNFADWAVKIEGGWVEGYRLPLADGMAALQLQRCWTAGPHLGHPLRRRHRPVPVPAQRQVERHGGAVCAPRRHPAHPRGAAGGLRAAQLLHSAAGGGGRGAGGRARPQLHERESAVGRRCLLGC